jgi:riboflavin transporter
MEAIWGKKTFDTIVTSFFPRYKIIYEDTVNNLMNISARKISLVSLFIAMSIVLTRLASIRIAIGAVEGIRIGFGKLPILLAGLILGPLYGAIVGGISDILGYVIQPIGPYMPHFTIISALSGIIPSLIMQTIGKKNYFFIKIALVVGITLFITDLTLTPYTLHLIFDIPWKILMIPRLISVPITIFVYTYIIHIFVHRKVIQFCQNYYHYL